MTLTSQLFTQCILKQLPYCPNGQSVCETTTILSFIVFSVGIDKLTNDANLFEGGQVCYVS